MVVFLNEYISSGDVQFMIHDHLLWLEQFILEPIRCPARFKTIVALGNNIH